MIELRQLRQFVAVAEELSFRRAAARLNMSQPPLTVAVKALEAAVGKPLLERSKHHVKLTGPGYLFLSEARRVLAQADRALQIARSASNGALRLSHLGSATIGIMPELLRHFRRDYPAIELHLTMAGTFRQIEMLRHGSADVGLIRVPVEDARGLKVTVLCEERMLIAVPAHHPLAGRRSVRVEMLAAEQFISYPPPEGPIFEGAFISACQRAGFYPRVVQHASQMLTKLSFVASGLGITLIPGSMRAVKLPGVVYLSIEEGKNPLGYALALASPTTLDNAAVPGFISTATRTMREQAVSKPAAPAIPSGLVRGEGAT
jgi:DNA-binding transcriptional LysR family regulator